MTVLSEEFQGVMEGEHDIVMPSSGGGVVRPKAEQT